METLLSLIFVFFLLSLLIGMLRPARVIRWGDAEQKTKGNVLKIYGTGCIITFGILYLLYK